MKMIIYKGSWISAIWLYTFITTLVVGFALANEFRNTLNSIHILETEIC